MQNPVYRYQHAGASCLKILQSPKQVSEWTCRTLTKLCGVISPKGTLLYLSGVSSSSHRLVSLDKTELELLSKASINHAYNIISTMHTAENQLNYRHVYNIKSTMHTAEISSAIGMFTTLYQLNYGHATQRQNIRDA